MGENFGIFEQINHLNRHKKSQHEKEKKIVKNKCDLCDYTSDRTYNVKQHEKKSKKCSEQSERTKLRQMKELKKELNITKKIARRTIGAKEGYISKPISYVRIGRISGGRFS